ncbi:MAG: multiheme c-type cytochrome [Candidatus Brocadiaceae bacterium]|nr:multiheme c-type cytochrome [Candidatus Brocadiaceae bacterium]
MIPCIFLLLALLPASLQAQEVCLLFSGEERGYLEPCGCAKPLLGGIAKRQTFLESLSEPWLSVSLGDLVGGDTLAAGHVRRQDELKAETLIQALKIMGHSIHNLGEMDLDMGLEVLAYLFPPGPVTLLSSNIRLSGSHPDIPYTLEIVPYKVCDVGAGLAPAPVRAGLKPAPLRIGFLGILSPTLLGPSSVAEKGRMPPGVEIIPPAEALPPLIRELKDKADVLVLLSHASMEESLKLARDFPEFQLIASGHRADHPVVVKEGKTWVFTPGIKGKHLVLYLYNPDKGSGVMEIVTLDERLEDSALMLSLLDNYQERLKEEKLLSRVERFPLPGQTSYVGSRACSPCHPAVSQHWGSTPHATAYETLLKAGRASDPECVACHVVGLNYTSGFQSQEVSPDLAGVGCEICHGPGSLHIANARRDRSSDLSLQDGYGKVSPEDCKGCHDPEHGPAFQFGPYWERIRHPVETPVHPGGSR